MTESPPVFLSYGSPDRQRVLPFYDFLISRGIEAWIDVKELRVGQNWDFEIKRALRRASIIIVFLSTTSIDRRGYVQREIKAALDRASEKLIDDTYLIPVILDDDASIPEQLLHIQHVRASDAGCNSDIERAIRDQLNRIGIGGTVGHSERSIRWIIVNYRDAWDGLPGYECDLKYPQFNSSLYPQIHEVSDVIKGSLLKSMMAMRAVKLEGQGGYHHFGEAKVFRTNTWEAYCSEPVIQERVLSILYNIVWYGAGAAHPQYGFRTFCFLVDPLIEISELKQVFTKHDEVLSVLQSYTRAAILSTLSAESVNGYEYEQKWVEEGTKNWHSFSSFVFSKDGLDVSFAPYQIASFSEGSRAIQVPYGILVKYLERPYLFALGLNYYLARLAFEAPQAGLTQGS